jgi:hypothetical protein
MFLFFVRKIQAAGIAVAALACVTAAGQLLAQNVGKLPNVTYTASGTFASPAISGNDEFKLAGEPFKINVVGNEATVPKQHGKGYGVFTDLKLVGQVTSALVPQSPFTIKSDHTFVVIAIGGPSDIVEIIAPVRAAGQSITIKAKITMPHGTLTKWRIYPFPAPFTLDPTNTVVTYSNKTASTTLGVSSGTLNAQKGVPGGGVTTALQLIPSSINAMWR